MAKFGEGHLAGMGRMGFKELGQALQPLPSSNVGRVEEPGVFGNPTQALVTQEMGGVQNYSPTMDAGIQADKGWEAMVKDAASRVAPSPEKGMER